MLATKLAKAEAGVKRVAERTDSLPVNEALLFRSLILIGDELTALLERSIRPFGLNETEYRVLMTLFSQPDGLGHPTELCQGTAQSPANMTRLIDMLVARGMVNRTPSLEDRRRTALRITAEGERVVRGVLPKLSVALTQVFAGFSGTEQLKLVAQLKHLATTMDTLNEPANVALA